MSTALLDIQKLLEAHQQAMLAEPEVHWEGQDYTPKPGVPWLQMTVTARVRAPAAISVGTPHLWRGQLLLSVKHPATEGLRSAYARAGVVAAHWKRGTTLGTPPLVVVVQEVGTQPAYTTAGWITQPVIVAWYAQEPPP